MPLVLKIFRQKFCLSGKNAGVVAGVSVAEKLLKKLDIQLHLYVKEGEWVESGALLISAEGMSEQLHQAWKVVQLVLEWSCGVAQYTAEMIANAKSVNQMLLWLARVKVFLIRVNYDECCISRWWAYSSPRR